MTQKNLLIVDDEYLITESLSEMEEWKDRNIHVVGTASTGREAIQYTKMHDLDIVITDIRMPDMNGIELLQYLFEHKPHIHVIIISGYEEFSYVHAALKYKAIGYVLKPIDTDELLSMVDEIISQQSEQQPQGSVEEKDAPITYHDSLIQEVISYMHMNIAKELTLKETAKEFHLTPHYLGQLFKTDRNETFNSYLTRIRLEKACELLRNSELKLYEVGLRIGYQDQRYFSRRFRQVYGITPKQFRINLLNEKDN